MYGQDLSFSLSIYYYLYESEDSYLIAYRKDGGPNKQGKEVTYAQARITLQEFLLDHGISQENEKDSIAAYSLDAKAASGSSVDDEPKFEKTVAVGMAVTCPPAQIRTCRITAYGSCLGF